MTQHTGIDDLLDELVSFRRDIHAHPELAYEEVKTAEKVAASLREIGLEVTTCVGKTGVVGTLKVGNSNRSLGLRADMDALPIVEETGLPYASCHHGVFHGCGHDGHTTMLLGAARQLARTRNFDGTVHFIFQPAEEGQAGAKAMIEDGLFDRFPCDRVYAFHNWPDLPAGTISTRPGPIMAAADKFSIKVKGKGGHAAVPHQTPDAILAASELVSQLNTIVSRRIAPTSTAVLSVTQISGGNSHNVLPGAVTLTGTVRTFDPAVQDQIEAAVRQVIDGVALASGTQISIDYHRYYPATINAGAAAEHALKVAATVGKAVQAPEPAFTSEDFAFMLQACEGAYVWLGQGRGGEHIPLHHPGYDFNDDIIATGVNLHVALVEDFLPSQMV
ncbi:M20 aminoacylase family protein [Alteromonas confluentis]|uniref:Peptidase M20 n=1 Tax=Alteromonas confluentis TaxID=1656094 RepID=A0A1E7Z6N5_9ALTE|nr:M20 aminoacylase family protein [Alteromonas confluentis]OFC69195.1 peptidase M20 [Alteromonas confluentis]